MSTDGVGKDDELTRRAALGALAYAGLAMSCGSSGKGSARASDAGHGDASRKDASAETGADGGTQAVDAGACEVTPEGEIGPYFADDSAAGFDRSSVTSNLDGTSTQVGVPLTLVVTVLDAKKSCTPYVGAQIDIWHCNASGVYSDIAAEGTSSEQWLRGYQLSDAEGGREWRERGLLAAQHEAPRERFEPRPKLGRLRQREILERAVANDLKRQGARPPCRKTPARRS